MDTGSRVLRFVLRRTGAASPEAEASGFAMRLGQLRGVTVLDATPRMLLVQGPKATLNRAVSAQADWELFPESCVPAPAPPTAPRVTRASRLRRAA